MSLSGSHLCCSLVSVVELSCRVAILARRPRLLRFPSKALIGGLGAIVAAGLCTEFKRLLEFTGLLFSGRRPHSVKLRSTGYQKCLEYRHYFPLARHTGVHVVTGDSQCW